METKTKIKDLIVDDVVEVTRDNTTAKFIVDKGTVLWIFHTLALREMSLPGMMSGDSFPLKRLKDKGVTWKHLVKS